MSTRLIAIAVVLGILLAACGGSDAEDAAAETTTTAAPTTTEAPTTSTTAATTTTVAETTTTTTTEAPKIPTKPVVPGEDDDVDAIVEVYAVVFDNTTTFEEKEPYVTDLSGLEDTVTKYEEAGNDVGGISIQADEVGIEGTEARVLYSFLFAGNPAYSDLEGSAVLTDEGWQITREFFCDIMASARVGCP